MTLIVGVEDPLAKCSYVFCDSGIWRGPIQNELRTPKIWRVGGWVLGMAGLLSHLQMVKRLSGALAVASAEEDELNERALQCWYDEVVEHLAPICRDRKDCGFSGDDQNPPQIIAACFDRVYYVGACAVRTTRGYEAVGVAREFAYGALSVLSRDENGMTGLEMGVRTMEAAYRNTDSVHGDVRYLGTAHESPPDPPEFQRPAATRWSMTARVGMTSAARRGGTIA